jgi:hypothetical protein
MILPPEHATSSNKLILIHLITLIIFDKENKKRSSLCNFILCPVTSFLLKIGNLSLSKSRRHTGRVEVWLRSFLAWAIYPLVENPATYWIKGWMGPRSGLDVLKKGKISCPCTY